MTEVIKRLPETHGHVAIITEGERFEYASVEVLASGWVVGHDLRPEGLPQTAAPREADSRHDWYRADAIEQMAVVEGGHVETYGEEGLKGEAKDQILETAVAGSCVQTEPGCGLEEVDDDDV